MRCSTASTNFRLVPFPPDASRPSSNRDLQPAGRERAAENDLLGVLADVDEAARARELRPEFADVQIAFAIRLRQPEESEIESAAIVEVELIRLIDDRLRVDAGAEINARRWHSADQSRLRRERDQVDDLFLIGDVARCLPASRSPD